MTSLYSHPSNPVHVPGNSSGTLVTNTSLTASASSFSEPSNSSSNSSSNAGFHSNGSNGTNNTSGTNGTSDLDGSVSRPPDKETEYLIAIHDFNGRSEDELTLKKGDHIQVIETDQGFGDGWFIGKNLFTNQAGLFPRVFTTNLLLPASNNNRSLRSSQQHQQLHSSSNRSPENARTSSQSLQSVTSPVSNSRHDSVHATLNDIDEAISQLIGEANPYLDTTPSIPASSPSLTDIPLWTPENVRKYFEAKGYEPIVCDRFVEHKITGSILLELDLSYLKEIDITSFGTRFEISKDIKYLNSIVSKTKLPPPSYSSTTSSNFEQADRRNPSEVGDYANTNTNNSMFTSATPLSPKPHSSKESFYSKIPSHRTSNGIHGSPRKTDQAITSPVISARKSSLNADISAASALGHRKEPSFDRNWTHPTTLKENHKPTPSFGTNDSGYVGSNPETPLLSNSLSTPHLAHNSRMKSDVSEYFDAVSPARGPTPDMRNSHRKSMSSSGLVGQSHSRKSSYVEDSRMRRMNHSRQTSTDTVRAAENSLKQKSFYSSPKHARSTSSLSFSSDKWFKPFFSSSNAPDSPTDKSHRRHSSIMSFLTPSASSPKRASSPIRKEIKEMFVEDKMDASPLRSKKQINQFDLGDKNNTETKALEEKRVSTDPVLTTTDKPPPSPKRSTTAPFPRNKSLKSSPSQSNLKRPFLLSKQKTSAFLEGIKSVAPQESLQTGEFSGWMSKRGAMAVGAWKSRFFVLHGTRLSYFTSLGDTRERGLIDITAHRVVAAGENEDKLIALYAASIGAGKYCFKLVPPSPGSRKGVTFTAPKVHYFAVDSKEDMRGWINALMKATIDRDETSPVISSCVTPTIPLAKARELEAKSRATSEGLRSKITSGNNPYGLPYSPIIAQSRDGSPSSPDSPSALSMQSSKTGSSATGASSLKGLISPIVTDCSVPDFQISSEVRHVTAKTAGLKIVTDLENGDI